MALFYNYCLGLSDADDLVSQTNNFMNVFSSVTSPHVLSHCCILHYFLTMPVGYNLRTKTSSGGFEIIVIVYKGSIFQVEWLIATLIFQEVLVR